LGPGIGNSVLTFLDPPKKVGHFKCMRSARSLNWGTLPIFLTVHKRRWQVSKYEFTLSEERHLFYSKHLTKGEDYETLSQDYSGSPFCHHGRLRWPESIYGEGYTH